MTKQPTVLVTGGAGYVGSHVCKALHRSGFMPVTLDNLSTGHRQAVKWGPLEIGDVRDESFVADIMIRHKTTAVLHFAALSLVGEFASKPHDYYDNNVVGALSLVAAMQRCGISRIVFSSTCAVYGMPDALPIEETEATRPINVYGRTKLAVENFLTDMAATGAIRTVLLRYFNAAGADAEGDIGEAHGPETHLVPLAIQAALHGDSGAQRLRQRLFHGGMEPASATTCMSRILPTLIFRRWRFSKPRVAAEPSTWAPVSRFPCARFCARSSGWSAPRCRRSRRRAVPAIRRACSPRQGARSVTSAGSRLEAISTASSKPPPAGIVAIFSQKQCKWRGQSNPSATRGT